MDKLPAAQSLMPLCCTRHELGDEILAMLSPLYYIFTCYYFKKPKRTSYKVIRKAIIPGFHILALINKAIATLVIVKS